MELNILIQWKNARAISEFSFDMPAISTTTKTIGNTSAEVIENDLKIDKMGLNMDDKTFDRSSIIIDLRPDINPSVTSQKSEIPYSHFLQGYFKRRTTIFL